MFDSFFNQDQANHSSFFNQDEPMYKPYFHEEQPRYYSHTLMNEIPIEFHQYVTRIQDVKGDGNCGFRAIAVSLGYGEEYWPTIRRDLHNELLAYPEEYTRLYDTYFNRISHSLSYFGTGSVGTDRWLIMPDTGYLIANRYGVIVTFLSKQGSSTCFPLRVSPEDIPDHQTVVIAIVHDAHYVQVDLRAEFPLPTLELQWQSSRSHRSSTWVTKYSDRLNAYISPFVSRNDCEIPTFIVPD